MKSNMFLSDLTVVDHAFIDNTGRVLGGSFNPGFLITGEVSADESVVVDFSTIKKDIKYAIDKHVFDVNLNGFDHKLWFIEGFSAGSYEIFDDYVEVDTPALSFKLPIDALRVIKPINGFSTYSIEFIGLAIAQHVYSCLLKTYPDINLGVECLNNINVHTCSYYDYAYFNYSHGLKNSTSYGCNNIAHGHLSYMQHKDDDVLRLVCEELDNAVFINQENISYEDNEMIGINYDTEERGSFSATYNKEMNKIIILDTETTIEFIAEYVKNKFNISDFYISEGLSKGAYIV